MLRPVEGGDRRGVRMDGDGSVHLPAGCDLLTHLYNNHGVRVRLVRRPPKREKIPTVRQLIDHLSIKHQQLLSSESDLVSKSSFSTHTTPLSQRLYGSGDGAGSSPHPGSSQEAVVGSGEVGGWDSRNNELQKLRELHGNGARPLSRNANHRNDLKAPYESFHEELWPLGGGLVGTKLPPNALKNHLMLRAEPCLPQRSTHGPQSGPEEDVVAMGSLWNSNHQLQTRGSSTVITTTTTTILTSSASSSSTKSISTSFGNGSGSGNTFTSISGSLPSRCPTLGATFTCHSSSLTAPSMGNIVKSKKERELEPKYCDPVPGAPPSFQQRLMELAALEAETVRWERSKKVKKKPLKQDKDS